MAVQITYDGKTTAVADGKTATMACGGKLMKTDVVVAAEAVAEVPCVIPAGTYKAGTVQLVEFQQDINFTSNGIAHTLMRMTYWPNDPDGPLWLLSYNAANVYEFRPSGVGSGGAGGWSGGEACMTITVPAQQEVSAVYFDWFTRSFAGIAPETVPEYDGTVTIA